MGRGRNGQEAADALSGNAWPTDDMRLSAQQQQQQQQMRNSVSFIPHTTSTKSQFAASSCSNAGSRWPKNALKPYALCPPSFSSSRANPAPAIGPDGSLEPASPSDAVGLLEAAEARRTGHYCS